MSLHSKAFSMSIQLPKRSCLFYKSLGQHSDTRNLGCQWFPEKLRMVHRISANQTLETRPGNVDNAFSVGSPGHDGDDGHDVWGTTETAWSTYIRKHKGVSIYIYIYIYTHIICHSIYIVDNMYLHTHIIHIIHQVGNTCARPRKQLHATWIDADLGDKP